MTDKGWKHIFEIDRLPRTLVFGIRLETYCYVLGWSNIILELSFWHRVYRLWIYKMGEG